MRKVGVRGNVGRSVGKCVKVWGRCGKCVKVEEGGGAGKCGER